MPERRSISARLSLAASLAALTVSACNQPASSKQQNSADSGQPASAPPIAALPLATAAPVAVASAPPVGALPPVARPLHYTGVPRADRYRYTERAYAMSSAFGDTPPDYTVDYQGTRPWIWRSNGGGYRVVEQVPGGQRDYYYQPGDTQPFYVSDPDGGYAYDRGELVAVYGSDGVPVDDIYAAQRADAAARYLYRAQQLYHAAQYQQRQAAYAADWQARRDAVIAQRQSWEAARERDADWRAWHDAHEADERRQWQDEQNRRLAYAAAIGIGVGATALVLTRHDNSGRPDGGVPAYGAGGPSGQRHDGYSQPPREPQSVDANRYPPQLVWSQSQRYHAPQQAQPVQAVSTRPQWHADQEARRQGELARQQQIAAAHAAAIEAQAGAARLTAQNTQRLLQAARSQRQAETGRKQQAQQNAGQRQAASNAAANARQVRNQTTVARELERQADATRQQQRIEQASRIAAQNANRARQQADAQRQNMAHEQAAMSQHQQKTAVAAAVKRDAAHQPENPKPQRPHDEHQNNHPSL